MEIVRSIANRLPIKWTLPLIAIKHYICDKDSISEQWRKIETNRKLFYEKNSDKKGIDKYIRELKKFCLFNNAIGSDKYLDSYLFGNGLKALKTSYDINEIDENDVILLCSVYNDLERIKRLVAHHLKIGIRFMVFVDNNSNDGTREWLEKQNVDLYWTSEKYSTTVKGSWIRKLQDIYGYNRWYLIVDSDELFGYIGMEDFTIDRIIEYAVKNNYKRIRSIMLDMYPEHELYSRTEGEKYDYVDDYRFFDVDSYYNARDGRGEMIRGGPRTRVFHLDNGFSEAMGKYPLVYAGIEDVWADHQPLPYYKNYGIPCVSVLKHYKFLAGDMEKYEKIIKEGNYANGSAMYKAYCKKGKDVSFYYENSHEWKDSRSLNALPFIETIE